MWKWKRVCVYVSTNSNMHEIFKIFVAVLSISSNSGYKKKLSFWSVVFGLLLMSTVSQYVKVIGIWNCLCHLWSSCSMSDEMSVVCVCLCDVGATPFIDSNYIWLTVSGVQQRPSLMLKNIHFPWQVHIHRVFSRSHPITGLVQISDQWSSVSELSLMTERKRESIKAFVYILHNCVLCLDQGCWTHLGIRRRNLAVQACGHSCEPRHHNVSAFLSLL